MQSLTALAEERFDFFHGGDTFAVAQHCTVNGGNG